MSPGDPALATVIDAWPTLPQAIRDGILAMVKAAGGGNFVSTGLAPDLTPLNRLSLPGLPFRSSYCDRPC